MIFTKTSIQSDFYLQPLKLLPAGHLFYLLVFLLAISCIILLIPLLTPLGQVIIVNGNWFTIDFTLSNKGQIRNVLK